MPLSLQGRGYPPALLFLLSLIGTLGPSRAWAKPAAPLPKTLLDLGSETQSRVSFRMDSLSANLKGRTLTGRGNVVVRQDTWLLCCDGFEAQADARGAWQNMLCLGQVRAYHSGRKIWADRAQFEPQRRTLTLTGRPRITQGSSHIEGARIVLHTDSHEAEVQKPQGAMSASSATSAKETPGEPEQADFLNHPLPDRCPWPWRPAPL